MEAISGTIKALRIALGDQDKGKLYVRTIHSIRYRFFADAKLEANDVANQNSKMIPAVLVRPFRAPSNLPETAYLTDGLTEDVIAGLSRQSSVRVLSYNTSRAFADMTPPESVGISHIIDGSVRFSGDNICINVSVLDGKGPHQIWGEPFDVTRASLLTGHDRNCTRLADLLSLDGSIASH